MLRNLFALVMMALMAAAVAGCTSHPDDRGDVTGQQEYQNQE